MSCSLHVCDSVSVLYYVTILCHEHAQCLLQDRYEFKKFKSTLEEADWVPVSRLKHFNNYFL